MRIVILVLGWIGVGFAGLIVLLGLATMAMGGDSGAAAGLVLLCVAAVIGLLGTVVVALGTMIRPPKPKRKPTREERIANLPPHERVRVVHPATDAEVEEIRIKPDFSRNRKRSF